MTVEWKDHEQFTEARLRGTIRASEFERFAPRRLVNERLLLDFSAVPESELTLSQRHGVAGLLMAHYSRIAVYAPGDLHYARARQVLMASGTTEGKHYAAFRDREEAIAWLLGDRDGDPT